MASPPGIHDLRIVIYDLSTAAGPAFPARRRIGETWSSAHITGTLTASDCCRDFRPEMKMLTSLCTSWTYGPGFFAHTPKVDVTSYAATIYAGWHRQAEPFMDLWRTQEDENGVGRPDLRKSRPVRDLANFASLFTYCILRGVLGACRWRCPDTGARPWNRCPLRRCRRLCHEPYATCSHCIAAERFASPVLTRRS